MDGVHSTNYVGIVYVSLYCVAVTFYLALQNAKLESKLQKCGSRYERNS